VFNECKFIIFSRFENLKSLLQEGKDLLCCFYGEKSFPVKFLEDVLRKSEWTMWFSRSFWAFDTMIIFKILLFLRFEFSIYENVMHCFIKYLCREYHVFSKYIFSLSRILLYLLILKISMLIAYTCYSLINHITHITT